MPYKKYIMRDGKLYGPYIYHSKRVDGKVVSEYHGQEKTNYTKFFTLLIGAIILVTFIYFIGFRNLSMTGHVVEEDGADAVSNSSTVEEQSQDQADTSETNEVDANVTQDATNVTETPVEENLTNMTTEQNTTNASPLVNTTNQNNSIEVSQEKPTQPTQQTQIVTKKVEVPVMIPLQVLSLTSQEKATLIAEFGTISVKTTETKTKNGFITVRNEIGSYWVENSYSVGLSNQTLNSFMEADRIKWLKDIARKLSQQNAGDENLPRYIGTFTITG